MCGSNYEGSCTVDHWCADPSLVIDRTLTGIWVLPGGTAWVSGANGTAIHWNGTEWSPSETSLMALPDASANSRPDLNDVWANDDNDVWMVGTAGTIIHWNGTAWSVVPSNVTTDLFSVFGFGSGDVWAVGAMGTVIHWTGSAWATVASTTTNRLVGIAGSAAGDIWAVGDRATVIHWNGMAWSASSVMSVRTGFRGVWASAANNAWLVGDRGIIAHWDGMAWTTIPIATGPAVDGGMVPRLTDTVAAVWGASPTDVWFAGWYSMTTNQAVGAHWDGMNITMTTLGTTQDMLSLSGSGNTVWAAGQNGTVLRHTTP